MSRNTSVHWFTSVLAAGCILVPLQAQTRVDLRSRQTSLKDQGPTRSTCITFAAVAALEAAYKRAGRGEIDLSEEFLNYLGKMNWLHPNWNDPGRKLPMIGRMSAGYTENQVSAFGGGSGPGYVMDLAEGVAVPAESYLPYRSGYSLGSHSKWTDPFWDSQRNVDDFNLDPRNLPRRAITATEYFRVRSYELIPGGRDPAAIEAALRRGYEVVWDFAVKGRLGPTWRVDSTIKTRGDHAMLIVGYDRSSSNPRNHVFICKNSWGKDGNTRADGYTYISYDYLRNYGWGGAVITSVEKPAPWPELAFLGRWNLCFDGYRGTLDISHIPGSRTAFFRREKLNLVDRRLGSFFDSKGNAFRVNGTIKGDTLTFWFKAGQPNMRWDRQHDNSPVGRRFVYRMLVSAAEMAGWHMDNAGTVPNPKWGGYAIRPSTIHGTDGFLRPVFDNTQPWAPEMYLGRWSIVAGKRRGEIQFLRRDDTRVPITRRALYAGLVAEYYAGPAVTPRSFVAEVSKVNPRFITLRFAPDASSTMDLDGMMLSWQRGVMAGDGTYGMTAVGFYAYRLGAARLRGSFQSFGKGCLGSSGRLVHSASGVPDTGQKISYNVSGVPAGGIGIFVLGRSRTWFGQLRLPLDLGFLGAPGCRAYVDHVFLAPVQADANGGAGVPFVLQDARQLVGSALYTQFLALDRQANTLGLTASNGLATVIGGLR